MPRTHGALFALLALAVVSACKKQDASSSPSPTADAPVTDAPAVIASTPTDPCAVVQTCNDPTKKLGLLDEACKRGEAVACRDAATVANDEVGDATLAASYLDLGCSGRDATSCGVLGLLFHEGIGVPQDDVRALALMKQSCALGREDACQAAADLGAASSERVPGANLRVGSMEADGLAVRDFQCRVDGGGALFGTIAVVGALAQRKKALDACAPAGEAPDVAWNFSGGKTIDIVVETVDAKVAACVRKAMAKVAAPLEGSCAATILIGERTSAQAKADAP